MPRSRKRARLLRPVASISITKRFEIVFWILVTVFAIYFSQTTKLLSETKILFSAMAESRTPVIIKWVEFVTGDLDQMRSSILNYTLTSSTTDLGAIQFSNKKITETFGKLVQEKSREAQPFPDLFKKYQASYQSIEGLLNEAVAGVGGAKTQEKLMQRMEDLAAFQSEMQTIRERLENGESRQIQSAAHMIQWAWVINLILLGLVLPAVVLFRTTLAQVLNGMQLATQRVLGVSENIVGVSREAQFASGNLSQTSQQQTVSVTDIRDSMKDLKSAIHETAAQSNSALQTADRMYQKAEQGVAVSDSLSAFMIDLETTYNELETINRAISEISTMTERINNIVFKTQILSFNASIEAAAAGSHGAGFAFIASEVGKLANTTGAAAEQINRQIEASHLLVKSTLEAARSRVATARKASNDGSRFFQELLGQASEVRQVVTTIHDMAARQGGKVSAVSSGVDQIGDGTQTLERAVGSVSGISQEMQKEAADLSLAVRGLRTLITSQVKEEDDRAA